MTMLASLHLIVGLTGCVATDPDTHPTLNTVTLYVQQIADFIPWQDIILSLNVIGIKQTLQGLKLS